MLSLLLLGAIEGRRPARANLWLGAAALFSPAAWRAAPALTFFNALAVLGLLGLLVANCRGLSLGRQPVDRLAAGLVVARSEIAAHPLPLALRGASQIKIEPAQTRRLAPVGRGTLLALPVLACFTVLLMAADSVFASYVRQIVTLQLPFDVPSLIAHLLFSGMVAWACAGGLLVALDAEGRTLFGAALDGLCSVMIGLVHRDPPPAAFPAEGITQPLDLPKPPPIGIGSGEALLALLRNRPHTS